MRLYALFRLAFATAPPHGLTSPHTITRRLILQKARGHFTSVRGLTTLPRLVGARFQVLFHDPSPGHFSPFPHGTGSLSVTREYLGLGGGPPGFTRDFSGPVLLGIPPGSRLSFAYGGVTLCADAFQTSSATRTIFYFLPDQQLRLGGPTTPVTQRLLALTRDRFGLFPFRSPLLRESLLLSLPVGTEMFHFPTLPPPALCVQAGAMGHYAPSGCPIRKSPDRSLVADSPGLIAGSYVLHRLLVPRHPPCALTNLANTMMLASTVQFSRYGRSRPRHAWGAAAGPDRGGRQRPFPQDPTACSASRPLTYRVPSRRGGRTNGRELTRGPNNQCSTKSGHPGTCARALALDAPAVRPAAPVCSLERR